LLGEEHGLRELALGLWQPSVALCVGAVNDLSSLARNDCFHGTTNGGRSVWDDAPSDQVVELAYERVGEFDRDLRHTGSIPGRITSRSKALSLATLEFKCLRKRRFATKAEARRVVAAFIDRYNRTRRHSSCEMKSPMDYEAILAARAAPAVIDEEAA
jgi:transposase InsO family protein